MICGVLLAAGSGTRFVGSTHKLLAEIEGVAVVAHALRSMLGAGFDTNVVVTGAAPLDEVLAGPIAAGGAPLVAVHNARYFSGMAGSLEVAVRFAARSGADAVVVGLGDQPFVPANAWRAVGASSSPIAVATYEGRQRNPVRLHRSVWPLLPLDGDEGARVVLRTMPELVEPVACDGFPDDIDTVEDLRLWS